MNELSPKKSILPFKSVAVALIFGAILGPIGVLYGSVWGGVVMIVVAFIVFSNKFIIPIIIVWLISCIWAVVATNKYNEKLLKKRISE